MATSTEVKNELKIPTYPIITTIKIDEGVLNSILKLKKKLKTEGILFGREAGEEIQVTSSIPFSITDMNIGNLTSYLEANRLDYMQVGFFFCNEQSSLITEANMKVFIEFQKVFPNAVILCLDVNMLNVNCYPFKCFRLSQRLMELVDISEIEEDVFYQLREGAGVQEENQHTLFKKFIQSSELLHMLSFRIISDKTSLFSILSEKDIEEEDKSVNSNTSSQPFVFSINRKM